MARIFRHTDPIDQNRGELVFDQSWRIFFAETIGSFNYMSISSNFCHNPTIFLSLNPVADVLSNILNSFVLLG